mgnify:CR=1 FL=1
MLSRSTYEDKFFAYILKHCRKMEHLEAYPSEIRSRGIFETMVNSERLNSSTGISTEKNKQFYLFVFLFILLQY